MPAAAFRSATEGGVEKLGATLYAFLTTSKRLKSHAALGEAQGHSDRPCIALLLASEFHAGLEPAVSALLKPVSAEVEPEYDCKETDYRYDVRVDCDNGPPNLKISILEWGSDTPSMQGSLKDLKKIVDRGFGMC